MDRRSSEAGTEVTSLPPTVMVPEVGSTMRLIIRSEVVLPQPDGPTNTVIEPFAMDRERLSTAGCPPWYCLVTLWNSIIAWSMVRTYLFCWTGTGMLRDIVISTLLVTVTQTRGRHHQKRHLIREWNPYCDHSVPGTARMGRFLVCRRGRMPPARSPRAYSW